MRSTRRRRKAKVKPQLPADDGNKPQIPAAEPPPLDELSAPAAAAKAFRRAHGRPKTTKEIRWENTAFGELFKNSNYLRSQMPTLWREHANMSDELKKLRVENLAKMASGNELNRLRDEIAEWSKSFGQIQKQHGIDMRGNHDMLHRQALTLDTLGKHQEDMLHALVETRDVVRQMDGTIRALLSEVNARTMLNYPPQGPSSIIEAMKPKTTEERLDALSDDMAEIKARLKVGWK